MSIITRTLVATALAVTAATAQAQPAPANLSGKWELNVPKSNFGGMPAPPKVTAAIEQSPASFKFTQTVTTPGGEQSVTQLFPLGAKDSTYTAPDGQPITSSSAWEGSALVLNMKFQRQGIDIRQLNKWTLSPDGKTMTMTQETATPMGALAVTLVWDKR